MSCLGVHFALTNDEAAHLRSLTDEQARLEHLQEVIETALLRGAARLQSRERQVVISDVRSGIVNGKKGTFAISWTTDEPATSVIILNGTTYSDTSLVTSHSRTFQGRKNTRYIYSVRSTDAVGNQIAAGPFTYQN